MNHDTDRLLRLAADEASAAATDSSRWTDCIAAIEQATNAAGAALFRPGPRQPGPIALRGIMALGAGAFYWSHWIRQDPWTWTSKKLGLFETAGEVRVSREFLSDDELRRTSYWNCHGRLFDGGHKLFLKVCDAGDPTAPVTHLTLSRSFRQEGFGEREKAMLGQLWPQLHQAVRTQALLQEMPRMRHIAQDHLDFLPHPCWVLRADAHIDFANRAAQAAMRSQTWVRAAAGRLAGLGDLEEHSLRGIVASSARGEGHHRWIAFQEDRGGPLMRAWARATPIGASPLFAATWPHAQVLLHLEMPPKNDGAWIEDNLARHYRLTPTECRVLQLLAGGASVAVVAETLRISDITVKTHLRALRDKTGRKTQAELVRLGLGN